MDKTLPSIYIKSIKIQNFNRIENFECKIKRQVVIFENDDMQYSKDLLDSIKWCFCLKSTGECFEEVLLQEKISVKITAKCGTGEVTFYKELCKGKEKYFVSRTRQDFKNYRRICEALYDSVASDLFFVSEEDKYNNIKKIISESAIRTNDKKSIISDSSKSEISEELKIQTDNIQTSDGYKLIFDNKLDAQFVKDDKKKSIFGRYSETKEKLRTYYTKLIWNKVITKLSKINTNEDVYPINRPPIFLDNIHSKIDESEIETLYENIYNSMILCSNPYQLFIIDDKEVVNEILSKHSNNIVVINLKNKNIT